jgi:hypothetical protein
VAPQRPRGPSALSFAPAKLTDAATSGGMVGFCPFSSVPAPAGGKFVLSHGHQRAIRARFERLNRPYRRW